MQPFSHVVATSPADAVRRKVQLAPSTFIAGGTNQIDLMKVGIGRPRHLIDIAGLDLARIEERDDVIRIGALATNSAAADDLLVRRHAPLVSLCLMQGASQQIRNAATVGGNLLQRTRCPYFYDLGSRCNRRVQGQGCDAIDGLDRSHAVFGGSARCIAVHPSDLALAMVALEARLNVLGEQGERSLLVADLHRLPGDEPHLETTLGPDELILSVDVPKHAGFASRSAYHKVRDRRSYAFALVSVAAALDLVDGVVRDARLAAGGVATKPWRLRDAERALIGKPASTATFRDAAEAAKQGASIGRSNGFKPVLLCNVLERALTDAAAGTAFHPAGTR